MQKALAFILAIVLTLGLAACSGDEREPNSPEPGTVWDAGRIPGTDGIEAGAERRPLLSR